MVLSHPNVDVGAFVPTPLLTRFLLLLLLLLFVCPSVCAFVCVAPISPWSMS